jgi:hypothetical protein
MVNVKTCALLRKSQLSWALAGGVPLHALEERNGRASPLLKFENRKLNLFREDWWGYIAHAENDWARALHSSQCFAVNVFGPTADDPALARAVLQHLLPKGRVDFRDSVSVKFEFTPIGAPIWLGERRQPTQIDVYFAIDRSGLSIGHVLVEVKFSELRFSGCRGWESKANAPSPNPDRSRCLNSSAIVKAPQMNCWLAENEGRHYWEIISRADSSISAHAIESIGPCPFRYGLYQMMRNRVLADELMRHTGAAWAEFAVCRHPDNYAVVILDEPLDSHLNAIDAFRSLSSQDAVMDWNAEEVVEVISSVDENLRDWKEWMRGRYFDLG